MSGSSVGLQLLKVSNCNHLPVYVIVEGVVAAESNQGA